jgi:hypothetical protein
MPKSDYSSWLECQDGLTFFLIPSFAQQLTRFLPPTLILKSGCQLVVLFGVGVARSSHPKFLMIRDLL